MPRVSEEKETRHTRFMPLANTYSERPYTTTTRTTSSGKKPASTPRSPAPQPRGILSNIHSKQSTPTRPSTTHEATRRPSRDASAKIVPGHKTHLQTVAMRPTTDGRCEWKLEVKGPRPGETIVEHGVAVRSEDKITTALFRVEHLSGGHRSSDRKDAGSSRKRSAGHRVRFQDTTKEIYW